MHLRDVVHGRLREQNHVGVFEKRVLVRNPAGQFREFLVRKPEPLPVPGLEPELPAHVRGQVREVLRVDREPSLVFLSGGGEHPDPPASCCFAARGPITHLHHPLSGLNSRTTTSARGSTDPLDVAATAKTPGTAEGYGGQCC